jgi:spermidine synthase
MTPGNCKLDLGAMKNGRFDMNRQLLFVVAILASSFLIFLVQPMVGKRILPWFGGTPGVWTLCLAFYQTTLFVGYTYAHLLIRFAGPRAQIGIHALLVGAAFVSLPVLPADSWQPTGVANPSANILAMLTSNVALPFIALASTGPLVQAWFARSYPHRSPYPLYAVSNIGSFAALLAYPFFLEPRLPLSTTGNLWSYAFATTAVAVLGCAFVARLAQAHEQVAGFIDSDRKSEKPEATHVALWILFSGSAVILLMGVTNSICLDIASVPFLWILPLAAYLLTFVLCFASERTYQPVPYVILTLIAFALTLGLRFVLAFALPLLSREVASSANIIVYSIYVQIPAYCALLFGGCMIMHGELYRLRPPPRSLTTFYLCISGGGALGGLFVGLLAPILFDDYEEARVGLALGILLFLATTALRTMTTNRTTASKWRRRVAAAVGLVVGTYVLLPPSVDSNVVIYRERSFFGVLHIAEFSDNVIPQRQLISGSTLHGVQFLGSRNGSTPSSYYGRATGIAAAFLRPKGVPTKVGLIGLGVGTLSAYGREGDSFRYYEIDPAVLHIARDSGYFTFLSTSAANIEIVLGDGRLAIAKEQAQAGSQEFDILILDAFNSDAIPVHLLTTEAFQIYANALATDGVLAAHVSNRHFDLLPLVARLGLEVGLENLVIGTAAAPQFQSQASDWILLSRNPQRLQQLARSLRQRTRALKLPPKHAAMQRMTRLHLEDVPLWTDDYSDLLGVLRSR